MPLIPLLTVLLKSMTAFQTPSLSLSGTALDISPPDQFRNKDKGDKNAAAAAEETHDSKPDRAKFYRM